MKIKNRKLLLQLIQKDCLLRIRYLDAHGKTCAIGCLAMASGVSTRTIENCEGDSINCGRRSHIKMASLIRKKFGLTTDVQQRIQEINDGCFTPSRRRSAIIKYIKSL